MSDSLDPYTYPGTEVLRNHLGIRDQRQLELFEANATAARLIELDLCPLTGRYDTEHLQSIHRYVFQDVYAWAGEFRTVNISKGGHRFAFAPFIQPTLDSLLRGLRVEEMRRFTRRQFVQKAAYYMGELNAVHPFRDGNGRAQREFVRTLAVHLGFSLDWRRVTREEMIAASRDAFQNRGSLAMERIIERCLD